MPAIRYEAIVVLKGKTEPSAIPSILVIRPDDLSPERPEAELLTHGFDLGVEAIRLLDRDSEYQSITPVGIPEPMDLDGSYEDFDPDLEKDGWRVFIEWEPQS
ncbi:hypothetical protein OVA24_17665 [Luteolibacter sp. SL250]|uniref:hypothetical protein n=1 Tax=Luteolibacter sp. SL250 TaxID=2995170 RepID=UPI00226DD867|nr:hypothetical protein [Luteolibacter sp. SL250]WAC19058.1 hypothetical protein OVA24_17665 [Luteolibacter sp. SL250]